MNETSEFTSEAVAAGHPDKVADRISDEILDECLRQNPNARVAVETLITGGLVVLAGEVRNASPDYVTVVRRTLLNIGYDPDDYRVEVRIQEASDNIDNVVSAGGANDQSIVYGYATTENQRFVNQAHWASLEIMATLDDLGHRELFLLPDGKCMVTLLYEDGRPGVATAVTVSKCHYDGFQRITRDAVMEALKSTLDFRLTDKTRVTINPPDGIWAKGGPGVDTGLTGRKIIMDSYGGVSPHGGGAFSGKDPTKIDRSGAYMARWLAKNLAFWGFARRCQVSMAYSFGSPEPVSLTVKGWRHNTLTGESLVSLCRQLDLTPKGIINRLDLLQPHYGVTASNGHFGHDDFTWELVVPCPFSRTVG